ncbi:hypothetical protein [Fundidesulfovibrio agrisoli]|nr:hypothetical protein [Fundidesulfovibrio agrisoli]
MSNIAAEHEGPAMERAFAVTMDVLYYVFIFGLLSMILLENL